MDKLKKKIKQEKIISGILDFLKLGNPSIKKKKIPLNKSLMELGYLDSFGIIELVTYLEKKYDIKIEDNEITLEIFGSIEKMADLVIKKTN